MRPRGPLLTLRLCSGQGGVEVARTSAAGGQRYILNRTSGTETGRYVLSPDP